MENRKLKVWESAALLALCLSLCVGVWAQGRQEYISSRLLRLHVIASSDEKEEQEIKLEVRDEVLSYLTTLLADTADIKSARDAIFRKLDGVEACALSASQGRRVQVRLCRERYPTRSYEDLTLPAGEYESLQVILGEGKGHNWWCVVFPPVCSELCQTAAGEEVMGGESYGIISEGEGYELRFKALELWGALVNCLAPSSSD